MKHRAHLRQCPCRTPWSLSSVDLGSTCCLGLWQTQCGPSTMSTSHTCQQYFFAVSLPPHSTTEQVSLNKWPPLPYCVRVEIRHWRDLQTEEAKIKKEGETTLEVTGAIRLKLQFLLRLCIWWASVDLEKKHQLEQWTIQQWTHTTLATTAPEKFLDIFLILSLLIFFKKLVLYYSFNLHFYSLLLPFKKKKTP